VTDDPDRAPDPAPDRAPAEEIEDLDPGAARGRTELAWRRTAISYAALGAALLRASPPTGGLVLAASAVIWGTGRLARAPRRTGRGGRAPLEANQRRLLLITVAVTLVSLAALVLALLAGSALPFR
jgi:uncharacterized membrane protein YidH (DUF202 family)